MCPSILVPDHHYASQQLISYGKDHAQSDHHPSGLELHILPASESLWQGMSSGGEKRPAWLPRLLLFQGPSVFMEGPGLQ